MIRQAELREWLRSHWGLDLTKNGGKGSIPYTSGGWSTGWTVSGSLPGCKHNWYWFRTLKEIAKRFDFKP